MQSTYCRECRHHPFPKFRINDVLLDQPAHLFSKKSIVDGVSVPTPVDDLKFRLPFMFDELPTKFFRMSIYVETELTEDSEPHIFGPNMEVVVIAISQDCATNKSVRRRFNSVGIVYSGAKGGLEHLLTCLAFRRACPL